MKCNGIDHPLLKAVVYIKLNIDNTITIFNIVLAVDLKSLVKANEIKNDIIKNSICLEWDSNVNIFKKFSIYFNLLSLIFIYFNSFFIFYN